MHVWQRCDTPAMIECPHMSSEAVQGTDIAGFDRVSAETWGCGVGPSGRLARPVPPGTCVSCVARFRGRSAVWKGNYRLDTG